MCACDGSVVRVLERPEARSSTRVIADTSPSLLACASASVMSRLVLHCVLFSLRLFTSCVCVCRVRYAYGVLYSLCPLLGLVLFIMWLWLLAIVCVFFMLGVLVCSSLRAARRRYPKSYFSISGLPTILSYGELRDI